MPSLISITWYFPAGTAVCMHSEVEVGEMAAPRFGKHNSSQVYVITLHFSKRAMSSLARPASSDQLRHNLVTVELRTYRNTNKFRVVQQDVVRFSGELLHRQKSVI